VPDVNILAFLNDVQGPAETKKYIEPALHGSARGSEILMMGAKTARACGA